MHSINMYNVRYVCIPLCMYVCMYCLRIVRCFKHVMHAVMHVVIHAYSTHTWATHECAQYA